MGKSSISDAVLYQCSIIGCQHVTTNPLNKNPRLRWVVAMELKDDNDKFVLINLCPQHVREFMHVDEDFFERTERTEKFIREPIQ